MPIAGPTKQRRTSPRQPPQERTVGRGYHNQMPTTKLLRAMVRSKSLSAGVGADIGELRPPTSKPVVADCYLVGRLEVKMSLPCRPPESRHTCTSDCLNSTFPGGRYTKRPTCTHTFPQTWLRPRERPLPPLRTPHLCRPHNAAASHSSGAEDCRLATAQPSTPVNGGGTRRAARWRRRCFLQPGAAVQEPLHQKPHRDAAATHISTPCPVRLACDTLSLRLPRP